MWIMYGNQTARSFCAPIRWMWISRWIGLQSVLAIYSIWNIVIQLFLVYFYNWITSLLFYQMQINFHEVFFFCFFGLVIIIENWILEEIQIIGNHSSLHNQHIFPRFWKAIFQSTQIPLLLHLNLQDLHCSMAIKLWTPIWF